MDVAVITPQNRSMTLSGPELTMRIADGIADYLGVHTKSEKLTPHHLQYVVADVFGNCPTQLCVIEVYQNPEKRELLAKRLTRSLQCDYINDGMTKRMLMLVIRDNFGPDALP